MNEFKRSINCYSCGYNCNLVYKCYQCKDCLICENCFDKNEPIKDHKSNHAMMIFTKEELLQIQDFNSFLQNGKLSQHFGISCKECKSQYILGYRFKCQVCVEYDLCQNCFVDQRHKDHQMIIFSKPVINQFNINDYELIKVLGQGFFAKVWMAQKKGAQGFYAIKEINLIQDNQIDLQRVAVSVINQIRAYNEIRSSYIVKYLGYSFDKEMSRFYVLMNWISEGTLQQMILKNPQKASLRRRIEYIIILLRALLKFHNKNFVHKDIKPDNLFLDRGNTLMLGDMGVSGPLQLQDRVAPVNWTAPQLLNGLPYGTPIDIFSFGLVLSFVFSEKEHIKIFQAVSLPQYDYCFKQIVKICISNKPQQRPSAFQLLQFFQEFAKNISNILQENGISSQEFSKMSYKQKNQKFKPVYDYLILNIKYQNFFKQHQIGNDQLKTKSIFFFKQKQKYWYLPMEKPDAMAVTSDITMRVSGIYFGALRIIFKSLPNPLQYLEINQQCLLIRAEEAVEGQFIQMIIIVLKDKTTIYGRQHKVPFQRSDFTLVKLDQILLIQKGVQYDFIFKYKSEGKSTYGKLYSNSIPLTIKRSKLNQNFQYQKSSSPFVGFELIQQTPMLNQVVKQQQISFQNSRQVRFFNKFDKEWRLNEGSCDAISITNISYKEMRLTGFIMGGVISSQSQQVECRVTVLKNQKQQNFQIFLKPGSYQYQIKFREKIKFKKLQNITIAISYMSDAQAWFGKDQRKQQDIKIEENSSSFNQSIILGILTE